MERVFLQIGASVAGNKLCEVASLCRGWLRPARFFEPQGGNSKHRYFISSPLSVAEVSLPGLFREATQLKTVGTIGCRMWAGIRHIETHTHPVDAADPSRPTVTMAADAPQCSFAAAAVARGGGRIRISHKLAEDCMEEWNRSISVHAGFCFLRILVTFVTDIHLFSKRLCGNVFRRSIC